MGRGGGGDHAAVGHAPPTSRAPRCPRRRAAGRTRAGSCPGTHRCGRRPRLRRAGRSGSARARAAGRRCRATATARAGRTRPPDRAGGCGSAAVRASAGSRAPTRSRPGTRRAPLEGPLGEDRVDVPVGEPPGALEAGASRSRCAAAATASRWRSRGSSHGPARRTARWAPAGCWESGSACGTPGGAAVPADPRAAVGGHHRPQRRDQAARGQLPAVVALLDRQPVRHRHHGHVQGVRPFRALRFSHRCNRIVTGPPATARDGSVVSCSSVVDT